MNTRFPGENNADKQNDTMMSVEQDLFELENYITDIWQFLPIPVAYLSPLGVVLDVSQALSELLHYSKEEIIGRTLLDFTSQKDEMSRIQRWTLERGNVKNEECSVKNKQGEEIFVSISTLVRKDEKGDPIGYFAALIDITELKQQEQKLTHMATHDALTGLPNRVLFSDHLILVLAQAQRNSRNLAVMMLDLDRFKEINDTLRHKVGDNLLQEVGNRLKHLLRRSDTVARLGGDEFMLLLPEISRVEDAAKMAQKILKTIREPFAIDGHELHVTTSIGIAMYPHDGEDVDTLMKNVDIAMYRAKAQGRNNYQHY